MLGSSNYGAQLAAFFGLPYCFAYFFNDGAGAQQALDIYRETYKPNALNPKPHAAITVWALAAETQAEADYHYQPRALQRLLYERGQFIAMPSPEAAAAFAVNDIERAGMARRKEIALCGTAPDVVARIKVLAERMDVDEIAITTSAYDSTVRQKSYMLLAREFGLNQTQRAA